MNDIFKSWLVENYIAHRGIHDQDAPENSILAFEKQLKKVMQLSSMCIL